MSANASETVQLRASPESSAFFDFWAGLREGALVPTFEKFIGSATGLFTPDCLFLELTDTGCICRFQGTRLVERWQRDATGSDAHLGYDEDFRARVMSNLRNVATFPCSYLNRNTFVLSTGRKVHTEMIHVPLTVAAGRFPRVVIHVAQDVSRESEESVIRSFQDHDSTWIDIGAGVPKAPPFDLTV